MAEINPEDELVNIELDAGGARKISITLPVSVVQRTDAYCRHFGLNRSAFLRACAVWFMRTQPVAAKRS